MCSETARVTSSSSTRLKTSTWRASSSSVGSPARARSSPPPAFRPRLAGERALVLGPLDLPLGDDPREARESSAVALFLERAASAGALSEIDDEVLREAAAIVRRLDGLPLALELAASRTSSVGLARLRRELEGSIDAVASLAIDAPAGHRTLQAAVQSSAERLAPAVRMALEAASFLPQDFALEELEGLLGETTDAHAWLQTLLDHSMVSARQGATRTELRFSIHAVVREVALMRAPAARRADLDARHAAWRASDARVLADDRSTRGAARIARAEDGLERAWAWTAAHLELPDAASWAIDLARALGRLVEAFGPSPAIIEVLDQTDALARAHGVDEGRRSEIAFYRAFCRLAQSELADARAIYVEACELAGGGRNPRFEALAWCQLAWLTMRDGDVPGCERALDEADRAAPGDPFPGMLSASLRAQLDMQRSRLTVARRGFERARALAVRVGDHGNEASASGFLGVVAYDEGAVAEAVRHYDRAVEIAAAHGSSILEAVFRGYGAIARHTLGDPAAADAYREAVDCARRSRSLRFESLFAAWYGVLLAEEGKVDEAARTIDEADGLPDVQSQTVCALHRGHVDLARADLGASSGPPRGGPAPRGARVSPAHGGPARRRHSPRDPCRAGGLGTRDPAA